MSPEASTSEETSKRAEREEWTPRNREGRETTLESTQVRFDGIKQTKGIKASCLILTGVDVGDGLGFARPKALDIVLKSELLALADRPAALCDSLARVFSA